MDVFNDRGRLIAKVVDEEREEERRLEEANSELRLLAKEKKRGE